MGHGAENLRRLCRASALYQQYSACALDPAPGQFVLYPAGVSETEILLGYGAVQFASKAGQLAGNHFLTITEGLEHLATLGRKTLWEGAQSIVFEAMN